MRRSDVEQVTIEYSDERRVLTGDDAQEWVNTVHALTIDIPGYVEGTQGVEWEVLSK